MGSVKMMKPSRFLKKTNSLLTLDNIVGLLLVLLIFFEFKVENEFKEILKSPAGMILSLVLLILVFVCMNPIVGLLFVIYLYECVKDESLFSNNLINHPMMKNNIFKKLNTNVEKNKDDRVDYDTIRRMAPIVKKRENPNATFVPHINDTLLFEKL